MENSQNWHDYEEVRMIRPWPRAQLLRSPSLLCLLPDLRLCIINIGGKGVGNRKLETYFHFPPGSMSPGYPVLIVACLWLRSSIVSSVLEHNCRWFHVLKLKSIDSSGCHHRTSIPDTAQHRRGRAGAGRE